MFPKENEREKRAEIQKCERDEERAEANVKSQENAGVGRTLAIGGTGDHP